MTDVSVEPASRELKHLTFQVTMVLPRIRFDHLRDHEREALNAAFAACAEAIDAAADQAVRNRLNETMLAAFYGDKGPSGGDAA